MAVTSLWAIKGRIDHLIHYVENPEKTAAGIADKDIQTLFDIVGYTTRPDKTEQRLFVDGINCIPEIAVRYGFCCRVFFLTLVMLLSMTERTLIC